MDRTEVTLADDLSRPAATRPFASLIATILMVAILAGMIAGMRQIDAGAPLPTDDPFTPLFALG